MAVQGVQDSGAVKGTLDLQDMVRVGSNSTITVEDYLKASARYDAGKSPNSRLAHVLQLREGSRLPISTDVIAFVNRQTGLWNASHPVVSAARDVAGVTQCPKGMTFVAAGDRVSEPFCVDNKATQNVDGRYPDWQDAVDFCEAAGKFLLTYEQHRLAAKFTRSQEVVNSGGWEWVLSSSRDDRAGQYGGFFLYDFYRYRDGEGLSRYGPGIRGLNIAFRCGVSPSPQDPDK